MRSSSILYYILGSSSFAWHDMTWHDYDIWLTTGSSTPWKGTSATATVASCNWRRDCTLWRRKWAQFLFVSLIWWILSVFRFVLPRWLTFAWWGCCGLCLWHKPTELAYSFLFCSCFCFCFRDPFNCISSHEIFPTTLHFLTLFFRSYFCLIGPFNYISLWKSPSALI